MKKKYSDYRLEAEAINSVAFLINSAAGKDNTEVPIPEASRLRKKPLAKAIIQHRLNNYWGGGNADGQPSLSSSRAS
jgi:hypothetical protein